MIFITHLGDNGVIWIIIAVLLMLSKKYRKQGIILAFALILCLLIGNITLKPLIARVRPFDLNSDIVTLISPPHDFSFPSGHTMSSFAAATIISQQKNYFGIASFVLAFLIAFSRLYLSVHYLSDVVAAMILGVMIGYVSLLMGRRLLT